MSGETKGLELSAACSLGQVRRVKDNHYYAGTPHANRALDLYLPGVKQEDTDMDSTTTTTTTTTTILLVTPMLLLLELHYKQPCLVDTLSLYMCMVVPGSLATGPTTTSLERLLLSEASSLLLLDTVCHPSKGA
ncbi:hypothetical protein BASA60_003400 [Batrachochytrium salamandrivorans]|nr:hypothetical protein BASA60_003400 [Batrachochytrium salamandrivorans]